MTTKLYFRTDTAPEPKPSTGEKMPYAWHILPNTYGGGQDDISATHPCKMSLTPGTANTSHIQSYTEPGAVHNGWVKQYVSPPLAAQRITGTFDITADFLASGGPTQSMNPLICMYVWKRDNSGSTRLAYVVTSVAANKTIGTLQFFFTTVIMADVDALDGDVIVIEIMWTDNNTKTVAYDHGFGYNGAVGSGYESYIEFSMNIAWQAAPSADQFMDQII